ncbi:AMP-binding protein [Thermocatellispora tengchongensis]|uniref:AMP-binding protein n=1 Tax=Thermocatellispora tengchongensis TaxID=1073253 RepID=UPI0036251532
MHPGAIAAQTPDKPAVIMAGSGRVVTYRELDEESNRLAHLFRSAGLRPGDHIAFMLENHPLFLAIAWAAHRSGLYYTAISSRLQAEELAYIVDNCEAQVFITSAGLAEVAASIGRATPRVRLRLMLDGTAPGFASYEEAVAAHPVTPIPDEVQGADMLYSSGTTGRPKGVKPPLSGARLEEPGPLYQLITFLFSPSADSVYLSPAPLYHAAPLRYCMTFQRLGATVVVMERFDPEQALAAIEEHRVTHSQWVPTMFIKMLKLPEPVRASYDLSSLRCAVHAAAPCPVPVKEAMMDWWGPIVHEYYAGTEGNGFCTWAPRTGSPTRAPSAAPCSARCTSATRWARSCPRASTASCTSPTGPPSSTTATPTRPGPPATPRAAAGPPSATSATSTRRASSTSPTAART